jgi:hypothetical protein
MGGVPLGRIFLSEPQHMTDIINQHLPWMIILSFEIEAAPMSVKLWKSAVCDDITGCV